MAIGAFVIPAKAKLNLFNATNLANVTTNWVLALFTSSLTPDDSATGNEVYADISANEIANGNGYTTGGVALTGVSIALSGTSVKFTSTGGGVWTASGSGIPAWRYGYIYNTATINGKVKPILAHFIGDTTPADFPATTAPNTLTFSPNASGIFVAS